jgi:hypothetical protein
LVHSGSWQIGKKDFQTERGNRSTHINSIISTSGSFHQQAKKNMKTLDFYCFVVSL